MGKITFKLPAFFLLVLTLVFGLTACDGVTEDPVETFNISGRILTEEEDKLDSYQEINVSIQGQYEDKTIYPDEDGRWSAEVAGEVDITPVSTEFGFIPYAYQDIYQSRDNLDFSAGPASRVSQEEELEQALENQDISFIIFENDIEIEELEWPVDVIHGHTIDLNDNRLFSEKAVPGYQLNIAASHALIRNGQQELSLTVAEGVENFTLRNIDFAESIPLQIGDDNIITFKDQIKAYQDQELQVYGSGKIRGEKTLIAGQGSLITNNDNLTLKNLEFQTDITFKADAEFINGGWSQDSAVKIEDANLTLTGDEAGIYNSGPFIFGDASSYIEGEDENANYYLTHDIGICSLAMNDVPKNVNSSNQAELKIDFELLDDKIADGANSPGILFTIRVDSGFEIDDNEDDYILRHEEDDVSNRAEILIIDGSGDDESPLILLEVKDGNKLTAGSYQLFHEEGVTLTPDIDSTEELSASIFDIREYVEFDIGAGAN